MRDVLMFFGIMLTIIVTPALCVWWPEIVSLMKSLRPPPANRYWEIEGVPLPTPDDPRWKKSGYEYRLGKFLVGYTGDVELSGSYIGRSREYHKALEVRFNKEEREALASEALKAIEESK